MNATHDNPMGLDGFEFVEFASNEPQKLASFFEHLGFTLIAKHRSKKVSLYRQGKINFIINDFIGKPQQDDRANALPINQLIHQCGHP